MQIRQAQEAVYFLTSSPRPLTLEVYKTPADFFFAHVRLTISIFLNKNRMSGNGLKVRIKIKLNRYL